MTQFMTITTFFIYRDECINQIILCMPPYNKNDETIKINYDLIFYLTGERNCNEIVENAIL